jgi:hypothetical protein
VRLDSPGFRVKSPLHYPQAWALVHFLMNGDARHKRRIESLLDALHAGASRTEALDRAFAGVDWTELESDFREHVESLE